MTRQLTCEQIEEAGRKAMRAMREQEGEPWWKDPRNLFIAEEMLKAERASAITDEMVEAGARVLAGDDSNMEWGRIWSRKVLEAALGVRVDALGSERALQLATALRGRPGQHELREAATLLENAYLDARAAPDGVALPRGPLSAETAQPMFASHVGPDRNSSEDWPEAVLAMTHDELREIVLAALADGVEVRDGR